MERKIYNMYSRAVAVAVLVIASFTYISTIEPTASFWDCGEFIASSYKLEVGHAPGNPVFQLIARFFTIFTGAEHAAVAVNVMSALCSAFTIFFLFLSIAHFGRRLLERNGVDAYTVPNAIKVLGSAVVGSLAYCWSDTFWFSAVEGEVYAMSSLFTAVVIWAILKWEEEADSGNAGRWILLIAFLMGLSIGVHLLNLLAIPGIAFVIYFKRTEHPTVWGGTKALLLSLVVLAFVLWGVIPLTPKMAAWVDLLFVNVFGAPFNSGAVVFMAVIFALCFIAERLTRKKGKVLLNTGILCYTLLLIGYSAFAVIVIRSVNNTPTNEYQPDNPFTLVRYLDREQYGSAPLLYGETYASVPVDYTQKPYYAPLNGKYEKIEGALDYIYPASSKMLFPRMWSRGDNYVEFYQNYTDGKKGTPVKGGSYRMPTFGENLAYFFDFQVGWMYFRYFFWNFIGRQNDFHSPAPGDCSKGNWESGIKGYDKWRLGEQTVAPDYFLNNKGKNHFYMLPFIFGLVGLFYQLSRDGRNWWVTMLLFLLTGIAIIVYLNQPPYQVRERDYAYAGSFYMFAVWIGLAVMAVSEWLEKLLKKVKAPEFVPAAVASVILLSVPAVMVADGWDDHDRSGRYTSRDLAYNYFMSCDSNAVLVTHGDNDTFPLWYIQEVEGVRLDCRVVNTSLLGTDWYIDQIQRKQYDSDPVKISTPREKYLYGRNEWVPVVDRAKRTLTVREAMDIFNNPNYKVKQYGNESVDFFPAHTLLLPVNKENAVKYGIISAADAQTAPDTIVLNIPKDKSNLSKPELIILDMLANYDWDRPLHFLACGGDLNVGIRDYLQYEGFSYKFVPFKNTCNALEPGRVVGDDMYNKVMNVFKWDSFDDDFCVDYQNLITFNATMCLRGVFVQTATALVKEGKKEKAVEVLDKMQECIVHKNYPVNTSLVFGSSLNELMVSSAIELYLKCGEKEKALKFADLFLGETLLSLEYCVTDFKGSVLSMSNLQVNYQLYAYTVDAIRKNAGDAAAEPYVARLNAFAESHPSIFGRAK